MSDLIARLQKPFLPSASGAYDGGIRLPLEARQELMDAAAIRIEAAAALAAKDAEIERLAALGLQAFKQSERDVAEIERLAQALGRMTADMLGMRDGALVRDQATEIEGLLESSRKDARKIARTAALFVKVNGERRRLAAEIATLRARLAAAEAVVEIARQEARIDQPELVAAIGRYDAAKGASDE